MVDATGTLSSSAAEKLPVLPIVGATFRIFGQAPVVFLLLSLVGAVPEIAKAWIVGDQTQKHLVATISVIIANLLIIFLIQTPITSIAVNILDGQPYDIGGAVRLGIRRYFPVFGTTMLYVLILYAGLILLVVPGLIWACMFVVAVPVCVIEAAGPVASLKRSAFLTKGTRWRVAGVYLLFFIPVTIVNLANYFLLVRHGHAFVGQLITAGVQLFWAPVATIFAAVIYAELRRLKENVGVARVFD